MHRATAETAKRFSDFSNRITHQEGKRRWLALQEEKRQARLNFYKSLLMGSDKNLLSIADDHVKTTNDQSPSERASLVLAYMCVGCSKLVSIQGYCKCIPDPNDEEVTSEDLWDEIYGSDSETESDSEQDIPLKKRKQ